MKQLSSFVLASLVGACLISLNSVALAQTSSGRVTTSAPTYATGTAQPLSLDTSGNLRVVDAGGGGGNQAVNLVQIAGNAVPTSGIVAGTLPIGGDVTAGIGDAGKPVKIGCVADSSTPPAVSDGQRQDVACNLNGALGALAFGASGTGADGVSNSTLSQLYPGTSYASPSSTPRPMTVSPFVFNGSTWDRDFQCNQSAVVNVSAGATTQVVSLTASQQVRVCSFVVTGNVAGTATFVYGTGTNCGTGTTALTGDMTLAAATPIQINSGRGSLFRTNSATALCLTAVTANVTGFVSYTKF